MQPPGRPLPLGTPFGAETPGAGQVVSAGAMWSSIRNGALAKWLENGGAVFVHVALSGGDVRFTSFCSRHWYDAPDCDTWVVCAGSADASPSTPSQPP